MATASQIADALAGLRGPVSFTVTYEQRNNSFDFEADLTDAAISGCKINGNSFRATFRTLSDLKLRPDVLPLGFDIDKDNVAVIMHLNVAGEIVDIPCGLFRLTASSTESRENGYTVMPCNGSDLTIVLSQGATTTTYVVAAGTNYFTAVATILTAQGLVFELPTTASVTPIAFPWDAGTSWWQICKDLCEGIGYYPPTPDARGVFHCAPLEIDPSTATPVVVYQDTAEPRMLEATTPWSRSRVLGQYKNVAKVIIDNTLSPAFGYKQSTNADPTSPISTATQPASEIKATGQSQVNLDQPSTHAILSSAVAGNLAAYMLRQEAAKALQGTFATFRDPRREAHESFTINIADQEESTLWQSREWTFDLDAPAASMQHTVQRSSPVTITVNV